MDSYLGSGHHGHYRSGRNHHQCCWGSSRRKIGAVWSIVRSDSSRYCRRRWWYRRRRRRLSGRLHAWGTVGARTVLTKYSTPHLTWLRNPRWAPSRWVRLSKPYWARA